MKKSLQRIVGILSILALFLCLFPQRLYAQTAASSNLPDINPIDFTNYSFSAQPGDSLSKIVRRALQLRAVTDQPVAMYCENSISTQLGGNYIEVSQVVVVKYQQIDDCTAHAKKLSQDERTAWQSYADTVSFNVNDISPTNNSTLVIAPQTPTELAPDIKPQTPTPAPQQYAKPVPAKPVKKVSATAWLITGSLVAIVAFIAGESFAARRSRR